MGSWLQLAAGALLLGGALVGPSLPLAGPWAVAGAAVAPDPAAAAVGPAPVAFSAASGAWASGAAQVQPLRACRPPATERGLPESSSELRLARDANGDFWQIQSGCRHRVVPLAMDPAVLRTIPLTDDVNFVTYTLPAPVPTAAPLSDPAYAQIPLALRPSPTPTPPEPRPDPGYLQGYADRVLVFDPAQSDVLYLLEGGTRHRVVTYYPYCVVYPRGLPICQPGPDTGAAAVDLPRGGDPTAAPPYPYLLRRRADVDCTELFPGVPVPRPLSCITLYEQMLLDVYRGLGRTEDEARRRARTLAEESAPFVANMDEIPLGEPAPNYGWGRGEVVVLSAQGGPPEARPCTTGPSLPGTAQAEPCSPRFLQAPLVTPEQYTKDPSAYDGADIRLEGVACQVRYDRQTNRTTLTIGLNQSSVPAVALGNRVRRDPNFADDNRLEVAAVVTPAGGGGGTAGQLVIFEYTRRGPGVCRAPGQGQ